MAGKKENQGVVCIAKHAFCVYVDDIFVFTCWMLLDNDQQNGDEHRMHFACRRRNPTSDSQAPSRWSDEVHFRQQGIRGDLRRQGRE